MQVIHRFISCIVCGAEIEVYDEDFEAGEVECPECGFPNEVEEVYYDEL